MDNTWAQRFSRVEQQVSDQCDGKDYKFWNSIHNYCGLDRCVPRSKIIIEYSFVDMPTTIPGIGLQSFPDGKRHFEQAPRVDRPPTALCGGAASSLPATQGQRSKDVSDLMAASNAE